jgi:hypothetical protein
MAILGNCFTCEMCLKFSLSFSSRFPSDLGFYIHCNLISPIRAILNAAMDLRIDTDFRILCSDSDTNMAMPPSSTIQTFNDLRQKCFMILHQ